MTSPPLAYNQLKPLKTSPTLLKVEQFLERSFKWLAPAFFGLVTLALFYDVLLLPTPGIVLSHQGHDITSLMYPMWSFAAKEIQDGHTPLWNPHIFSGTPLVGNFNSGLFYPVNWLIRWLPLAMAINWILALGFFLSGYFAALWSRVRGLSTVACLIAGIIYAFSGPLFLHLYPGHVPVISAAPWVPVIFLAIEALRQEARLKWALVGGLAVGMQILTGFPQVVYYTALLAGIYTLCCLPSAKQPLRMALLALLFYVLGPAIGSVQLLPGLQTAGESARAGGNAFDFAAMTALPPENLVMTIAPHFFGDIDGSDSKTFVGSSYPWEHNMFLGVAAVSLALYGIFCGTRGQRRWVLVGLSALALALALGVYITPFFRLLFNYLPLYGSFRGTARFNIQIALFVGLLAGIGWDALAKSELWALPLSVFLAAILLACMGGYLCFSAEPAIWKDWLYYMAEVRTTHFLPQAKEYYQLHEHILDSAVTAGEALFWAAGGFAFLGLLLALRIYWPIMRYAVALFLVAEVLGFAANRRPSGPAELGYPENWQSITENLDPSYRILMPEGAWANVAMLSTPKRPHGFNDVYGYDPVVMKRYAQLLGFTQGYVLDDLNFSPPLHQLTDPFISIFSMLRFQFIFGIQPSPEPGQGAQAVAAASPVKPMSWLTLVGQYEVHKSPDDPHETPDELHKRRDEILRSMAYPAFDPRRKVALESTPDPAPNPPAATDPSASPDNPDVGTVEMVRSNSDELEIRADLKVPQILVVTDVYSKYWKVRPLEAGPQKEYHVMPADFAFRAVPLAAGKHHFVMEYKPDGFAAAKALSIGTCLGAAGLCLWLVVFGRKPAPPPPSGS